MLSSGYDERSTTVLFHAYFRLFDYAFQFNGMQQPSIDRRRLRPCEFESHILVFRLESMTNRRKEERKKTPSTTPRQSSGGALTNEANFRQNKTKLLNLASLATLCLC